MASRISFTGSFTLFCFLAAIPLILQDFSVHAGKASRGLSYDGVVEKRFISVFVLTETVHLQHVYVSGFSAVEVSTTVSTNSQIPIFSNEGIPPARWWQEDAVYPTKPYGRLKSMDSLPPKLNISFADFTPFEYSFSRDSIPGWQLKSCHEADIEAGACRICILILSIFIFSVISSAMLGTYFAAIALYSLGDSFTVAAYVLAVGAFAWSALMAWHTLRCKLKSTSGLGLGLSRQGDAQTDAHRRFTLPVHDFELELESQTMERIAETGH
ncbi:hypothetical protein BKA64DRAFT_706597 [Cadophora sp. MPI-SDFR-AT-0126]|nr:hypothetical protein BKA64DRAFT_706597 [Leotiomycetes sp. MPI-SDFR-AT-0126]